MGPVESQLIFVNNCTRACTRYSTMSSDSDKHLVQPKCQGQVVESARWRCIPFELMLLIRTPMLTVGLVRTLTGVARGGVSVLQESQGSRTRDRAHDPEVLC